MPIKAYQLTANKRIGVDVSDSSSLDSITRELPDGYYSTFRTYGQGTRVVGLKSHLRRLYQPVTRFDADEATLRAQLASLLKEYPDEARVRAIMTKGGQVYIAIEGLKRLPGDVYERGVRVETAALARNAPRLKSTAFISASEDERRHISQAGIFEALLTKNGKILEGMTSNFFYILGNARRQQRALYTAQRDILLGVTRRTVIRVARGMGLDVRYQPLKLNQLEILSEAFITSSSRGVVPVVQIDDIPVGQGRVGQVTRELASAYQAYVLKKAERV